MIELPKPPRVVWWRNRELWEMVIGALFLGLLWLGFALIPGP